MLNRLPSVLTACALALGASAALAQTPPPAAAKPVSPTTVAPVTVEAATRKVIQKQTSLFVEALAAATPKLGQIGRWREPICVQVVNLAPEQAAMVQKRIEQVASGVGLRAQGQGCRSNIQIVLTGQPQAVVDKIAKADDHVLGFHYPSDTNKVKAVTHPIQGWYKTATQGSKVNHDGLPFSYLEGQGGGLPGGPGGANKNMGADDAGKPDAQTHPYSSGELFGEVHHEEIVDLPENGSPAGCAGSLINDCLRSVFKNVLIVVDSNAVAGKDLGAIADYLALLALAQPRSLDGCSALPSILDLMAKTPCPGRDPPDELTGADAAYLTALYASEPEAKAASERVDMAGRMTDILSTNNASAKASR